MMGWVIAIIAFLTGCFTKNDILVITSGLYAIAGAISFSSFVKNKK